MRDDSLATVADRVATASAIAVLFLLPLVFSPGSRDAFGLPKAALLWVLGLVGLGALLISRALSAKPLPRLRASVPALALLVATAMATATSVARNVSVRGFYGRYNGLATLALCAAVGFVIAAQYRDRPGDLRTLMVALSVASVVVCVYAFVQWFRLDPIHWGSTPAMVSLSKASYALRPGSTIGNPDFAGGTLAITLPITLSLGVGAAGWKRAVWLGVAAMSVVAMCIMTTRGGLLGAAAGVAVFALFHRHQIRLPRMSRRRLVLVVVASLALLAGLGAGVLSRTSASDLVDRTTFSRRWQWWHSAAGVFASNPVLGTGPDTFYAEFGRHRSPRDGAARGIVETPDKPHNIYLEYAAGTGLLGVGAYFALIAMTARSALRKLPTVDPARRLLLTGFVAALVAYLVQAVVGIDALPLPVIEWACIGAIAALADPGLGTVGARALGRDSRLAFGAVGVALLLVSLVAIKPWRAGNAALTGDRLWDAGKHTRAVAHYARATRLDPREGEYFYVAATALEQMGGGARRRVDKTRLFVSALALYQRADRRSPDQPFVQRSFARAMTTFARTVDQRRFADADKAWQACVDNDPWNWELRAAHAEMLAWWASAGSLRAGERAASELRRILAMPGLEKRARPELVRIGNELPGSASG